MTDTSRSDFDRQLASSRVVPVVRTIFADALTPVGLYRALAENRPGGFLLESAEQGGIWSRYSFIGVRSFGVLTEHEGRSAWIDYGLSAVRAFGDEAFEPRLRFRHGVRTRYAEAIEAARTRLLRQSLLDRGGIGQKSRSA